MKCGCYESLVAAVVYADDIRDALATSLLQRCFGYYTSVTTVIVLQFPFLVIRSARFKMKNTIKNKSELSALGCDVGEPWIGVRGRNCVP